MKVACCVVAIVLLASPIAFAGDRFQPRELCGDLNRGIRLCLSTSPRSDVLLVRVKNIGPADASIRLGTLDAGRYSPDAISLYFTDEDGGVHRMSHEFGKAGHTGPIGAYIVPLPAGASFQFPIYVGDAGEIKDGKFQRLGNDPKKHFTVHAELVGTNKREDASSLDPRSAYLPLWTGTVVSASIPLPAQPAELELPFPKGR